MFGILKNYLYICQNMNLNRYNTNKILKEYVNKGRL